MPQIRWAVHSYRARSLPLSAQQVVNLYAEAVPKDAKSPVVLFGTPGIKSFCDNVGDGPIRGTEVMDGVLYALSGDVLYSVDAACVVTALGSIGVGADSTFTSITGAFVPATANFKITGGSTGSITSITVGGVEAFSAAVDYDTDNETTAAAVVDEILSISTAPRPELRSWTGGEGAGSTPGYNDGVGTSLDVSVDVWDGVSNNGNPGAGDLLMAWVTSVIGGASASVISPPGGWVEIFQESLFDPTSGPSGNFIYTTALYFKFFESGDGTFTFTSSKSGQLYGNTMWMRDVGQSPYAVTPHSSNTAHHISGEDVENTDLPFVVERPEVMAFVSHNAPSLQATRFQPPAGWFRRTIDNTGTGSSDNGQVSHIKTTTEYTGPSSTGVFNWATINTYRSIVNMVSFQPPASIFVFGDYEIISDGSTVKFTKLSGGGETDPAGPVEIVITTTGDVAVAC